MPYLAHLQSSKVVGSQLTSTLCWGRSMSKRTRIKIVVHVLELRGIKAGDSMPLEYNSTLAANRTKALFCSEFKRTKQKQIGIIHAAYEITKTDSENTRPLMLIDSAPTAGM